MRTMYEIGVRGFIKDHLENGQLEDMIISGFAAKHPKWFREETTEWSKRKLDKLK